MQAGAENYAAGSKVAQGLFERPQSGGAAVGRARLRRSVINLFLPVLALFPVYSRFDKPGKKPEDIRKAVEVSNGFRIDAIGAAGHGDNAALCSPAGRSGHVQRGSAQIMAGRCPMFEDDVIVFFQVVHHIG